MEQLTNRMVRVSFAGIDFASLVALPAASVRLLLPSPGTSELVMPGWNGNEFLLPNGERPTIRTFTPRRVDPQTHELDLEIVIHDGGFASGWARAADAGDPAAISGPGRGFAIDGDARGYLLAGDETALPAIGQLLEAIPPDASVQVFVEIAAQEARLRLPDHPRATVEWCDLPAGAPPGDSVIAAVRNAGLDPSVQVWAAGEAAAMRRLRSHLFEEVGLPRRRATVRGYWKQARRQK